MKQNAFIITIAIFGLITTNVIGQDLPKLAVPISKDYPLRFNLTQDHEYFSKTNLSSTAVKILDFGPDSPKGTVLGFSSGIGRVSTNDNFLAQLKSQAALLGCNFVKLVNGREDVKKIVAAQGGAMGEIESDYVCLIGVLRQASLGITYDPNQFRLGKQIVAGFDPSCNCRESGLMVGDEVIAVDDILLSDRKAILKALLNWEKKQKVSVRFRRGGKEKTIKCETF